MHQKIWKLRNHRLRVFINKSLWSSEAIWWWRTGSALTQVMACCLTAPSHYLNQCWHIIKGVLWHSSRFTGFAQHINSYNGFVNKVVNFFHVSKRPMSLMQPKREGDVWPLGVNYEVSVVSSKSNLTNPTVHLTNPTMHHPISYNAPLGTEMCTFLFQSRELWDMGLVKCEIVLFMVYFCFIHQASIGIECNPRRKSEIGNSWWRHQMETFSALLAICAGNSPVPGEFPAQRPATQGFDVFFDLRLNKRLSK